MYAPADVAEEEAIMFVMLLSMPRPGKRQRGMHEVYRLKAALQHQLQHHLKKLSSDGSRNLLSRLVTTFFSAWMSMQLFVSRNKKSGSMKFQC
jgi:hypothetical protein